MVDDLRAFLPLQIQLDPIGTVLTGKIGGSVALILEDPTPIPADAQYTNFSLDTYSADVGVHPVSLWRRLTFDQLRQLQSALKSQEGGLPTTVSPALFYIFLSQVDAELAKQPSTRFATARFGAIARDASGAVVGYFSIGDDVVGIIHDRRGISAEQHVVPLPPGAFKRLSKADRLSLAAAIAGLAATVPGIDPLWRQVEHDASG
jgi:hypothetical protein